MSEYIKGLLKNRYRLTEVIGAGGMARVYHAVDTSLGRDVAIKLFEPSTDEAVLQRQEDEVNVLASLSHHGMVTLLDAGVDRSNPAGPRLYIVMELVRGADLQRTLAEGPLGARQVAYVGYDMAETLQYIHYRGVVHRDIKPSNILFVDYDDQSTRARAKLTDFGIAFRGVEQAPAEGSTTTGTAAYLSPEQVLREEVGPPSDVYALGLVLLECFTGTLAFPGEPVESAIARVHADPEMADNLSPEWRSLLTAMTSREQTRRPEAPELVMALRDLVIAEVGRHAAEPEQPLRVTPRRANTFDHITHKAAEIFSAPIAIATVADSGRAWFKEKYGIDLAESERETGRYNSAILYQEQWIADDASSDPAILADPEVASRFGLEFFVSVPLLTPDGHLLGQLCVLDFEDRPVTDKERGALEELAASALTELGERLAEYQAGAKAK